MLETFCQCLKSIITNLGPCKPVRMWFSYVKNIYVCMFSYVKNIILHTQGQYSGPASKDYFNLCPGMSSKNVFFHKM